MSVKTLYVSDLDGTLLAPDSRLSLATITLLNHAISEGALFSVATARTPATVSKLLKDVNVKIPLVVMTGAALWDKAAGVYSDVQYFNPSQVGQIADVYGSVGDGGGFLYTLAKRRESHDLMEIYHIGSINKVEREFMEVRRDNPFKKFYVPSDGLSDLPADIGNAVLFFGMQSERVAREINEKLHRIEGINPMLYYDRHTGDNMATVEAFPQGASKAQAIARLKKRVGADRVVVFGDNINDLSMMEAADWSVAVGNALPEVKYAADEIIGSNSCDAVPRYILGEIKR